jgi:hypothetical protein
VKITLALLAAYAIVGVFHSCREFYRSQQLRQLQSGGDAFVETLQRHMNMGPPRHRWFMCGLTWLPTSIVFPFMSPPFGGSARIWRRENLKDSAVSWLMFALIVSVGIWGI